MPCHCVSLPLIWKTWMKASLYNHLSRSAFKSCVPARASCGRHLVSARNSQPGFGWLQDTSRFWINWLSGTPYAGFHRQTTLTTSNQLYDQRNIVTLSRFPISSTQIIRDSAGPRRAIRWLPRTRPSPRGIHWSGERPMLYTQIDIGSGRALHLINVHLKSKIASTIRARRLIASRGEQFQRGLKEALSHP